jgi:RNA 2',3'-cyclic 3'-phosphodiesterase
MRTFVALGVDDSIRERITRFVEGVQGFAPDARWVPSESIHVTLKFIGEKSPEAVEKIKQTLARIGIASFDIAFRGYGFFPTTKAPRVFWIGIEAGPQISSLAKAIDEATSSLGIPPEDHRFNPHLTLARGGGGSGAPHHHKGDRPNSQFQRLQEKLSALPKPEFGTMTAHEFFLYESQLLRGGARYTKIARYEFA